MKQKKTFHYYSNYYEEPRHTTLSEKEYRYLKGLVLNVFSKDPLTSCEVTESEITISRDYDDKGLKILHDLNDGYDGYLRINEWNRANDYFVPKEPGTAQIFERILASSVTLYRKWL